MSAAVCASAAAGGAGPVADTETGPKAVLGAWLDVALSAVHTPYPVGKGSAQVPFEKDDSDTIACPEPLALLASASVPSPLTPLQDDAAAAAGNTPAGSSSSSSQPPPRGGKRTRAPASSPAVSSSSSSVATRRSAFLSQPLPFRVSRLTVDFDLTRYSPIFTRAEYDLMDDDAGGDHMAAPSEEETMAAALASGFLTVRLPLPDSDHPPTSQQDERPKKSERRSTDKKAGGSSHASPARGRVLSLGWLLDLSASFYSSRFTPREMKFMRECAKAGKLDRGDAEQKYLLSDVPKAGWPSYNDLYKGGWTESLVTSALTKHGLSTDGDHLDQAVRYFVSDFVWTIYESGVAEESVRVAHDQVNAELVAEAAAAGNPLTGSFTLESDWSDAAQVALARALWARPLEGAARPALFDHEAASQLFVDWRIGAPGPITQAIIALYMVASRAHPELGLDAIVEQVRAETMAKDKGKAKGKAAAKKKPAAAGAAESSLPPVAEKPPCVRRRMLGGRDRMDEIDVLSAEYEGDGDAEVHRRDSQPIHLRLSFALST